MWITNETAAAGRPDGYARVWRIWVHLKWRCTSCVLSTSSIEMLNVFIGIRLSVGVRISSPAYGAHHRAAFHSIK